jgi:hypothetical protein
MKILKLLICFSILITLPLVSTAQNYKVKMNMDNVSSNIRIGEITPLGPVFAEEEWITFANNRCNVNITDVSQLENMTLNCYNNGAVNNSNVPSSGFGTYIYQINFYQGGHTHFDFLHGLETVGAYLYSHSSSLMNVDGLSSLTSVGTAIMLNNSNLQNINGLSSLVNVGSNGIYLNGNPSLDDLSPLNGVSSMGTVVQLDNREYTVKMSANSYICLNNKYGPINISKQNICEI